MFQYISLADTRYLVWYVTTAFSSISYLFRLHHSERKYKGRLEEPSGFLFAPRVAYEYTVCEKKSPPGMSFQAYSTDSGERANEERCVQWT